MCGKVARVNTGKLRNNGEESAGKTQNHGKENGHILHNREDESAGKLEKRAHVDCKITEKRTRKKNTINGKRANTNLRVRDRGQNSPPRPHSDWLPCVLTMVYIPLTCADIFSLLFFPLFCIFRFVATN